MGGLYPITSILVGEKKNWGGHGPPKEQCSSTPGMQGLKMEDSLMLRTNFLHQEGKCINVEAQATKLALLALSNAANLKSLTLTDILEGNAMNFLNLLNYEVF